MINKDTKSVLKNLIPVNNSMIVEPVMHGKDEVQSLIYRANLNKIDEDIKEFGIFDMSSFLSSLDLLSDDANVELENNKIVATDSNSSLTFVTSDPSALEDVQVNSMIIDSTLEAESILEFEFDSDFLSRIKKASSVFKTFDALFIIKNGDNIQLQVGSKDSFNKSKNSFSIDVEPDINFGKDFEIAVTLESILKIPAMDYKFMIKYNKDKDMYRVVLNNELLTFIVSMMK